MAKTRDAQSEHASPRDWNWVLHGQRNLCLRERRKRCGCDPVVETLIYESPRVLHDALNATSSTSATLPPAHPWAQSACHAPAQGTGPDRCWLLETLRVLADRLDSFACHREAQMKSQQRYARGMELGLLAVSVTVGFLLMELAVRYLPLGD
jgi:hypothetical protein